MKEKLCSFSRRAYYYCLITAFHLSCPQVRYIGVSNETSYGVSEFSRIAQAAGLPKIVSIQNSYSLLVRASGLAGEGNRACW